MRAMAGGPNGRWTDAALIAALALSLGTASLSAEGGQKNHSLDERVSGASRVVVAKTRAVTATWRQNEYGDRIIVSRVELEVEEAIKGQSVRTLWMDLEGGTIDGLTMKVSSLPLVEPGERAVFFLEGGQDFVYRPFLRGQGILKLDDGDLVRGSSLHVNEIRSRARTLGGR